MSVNIFIVLKGSCEFYLRNNWSRSSWQIYSRQGIIRSSGAIIYLVWISLAVRHRALNRAQFVFHSSQKLEPFLQLTSFFQFWLV